MEHQFKIIAIDPGSQTLGIAIYIIDSYNMQVKDITTSTLYLDKLPMYNVFNNEGNRDDKLLSLYNFMLNLFKVEKPSSVIMEAPFFNRFSPKAYGVLTEVVTYIKMAVVNYSVIVDVHTVEPLAVKKAVGVGYRDGKEGVSNAVMNNPIVKPFLKGNETEHEYDAIAVGWWLYKVLKIV